MKWHVDQKVKGINYYADPAHMHGRVQICNKGDYLGLHVMDSLVIPGQQMVFVVWEGKEGEWVEETNLEAV